MSKITVSCPKCNHELTVNIKTIDSLREELKRIKAERDNLRGRLAALENMNNMNKQSRNSDDSLNFLKGIFGGMP